MHGYGGIFKGEKMSTLSKAYQDAMNIIDGKVEKAILKSKQKNRIVIYSAYDYDSYDVPEDNLHEIPIKGKVKFVDESSDIESDIVDSPTWLEIAVIANKILIDAMDYHHVYLEDIEVICYENEIYVAKLIMGS